MLDDLVRKDRAAATRAPTAPAIAPSFAKRAGIWASDSVKSAKKHPILAGGIALLLLAAIGYSQFGNSADTSGQPIVATATIGDIEDDVTALGNLQPSNYVDVGAQASGQVKNLTVNIGDQVKEGQLLAEIDPTVLGAKVAADQAQLANLQAQLLDKQSTAALNAANADRQTRLKTDNATSQSDYDAAQAAMRSSAAQAKAVSAQITQSQSTLAADTATLGYTKIYAPMSGTVSSITTKQGMTVNANQQAPVILQIADLALMTVQTQVSEADVSKLKVGMDAYFTTLGAPNKRWYGKLKQIWPTPTVVNNVVLYTALFDVANPDNLLMSQMTAQVFFIVAQAHNVVTVPAAAVHVSGGGGRRGAGANGLSANGAAAPTNGTAAPTAQAQNAAGAGNGSRNQGGNQGGGRRRQNRTDNSTTLPGRLATVTVLKDDGTTEIRNVVVGVSDRVTTEIRSGLAEGEKVVTGEKTANTPARPRTGQQGNGFGGGGIGGFGGAP